MNVPLLRTIQSAILAEPDGFRMDTWSCGTAHCIAGWALKLNGFEIENPDAHAHAQRLVGGGNPQDVAEGLLDIPSWQGTLLFNTCEWPREFEDPYNEHESRSERARVAVEFIDHFIATNGERDGE